MQSELVSFINRHDVPGWGVVDDKASLTKLIQMETGKGRNGRISHYPETFIMPEHHSRLMQRASDGPWIAKHSALFGGQGIVITADASATPDTDGWVVQRYVDEPLLIQGRKAHVRIYLLVESIEPFRAYLYGNGIVRHAPLAYSPVAEGATQDGVHITNTARYKHDKDLSQKATVSSLDQYLKVAHTTAVPTQKMTSELFVLASELAAIIGSIQASTLPGKADAQSIPPKLLGLDVLFDRDGKAWLLEVERYPALTETHQAGHQIQRQLMTDVCNLIVGQDVSQHAWTPVA